MKAGNMGLGRHFSCSAVISMFRGGARDYEGPNGRMMENSSESRDVREVGYRYSFGLESMSQAVLQE
jgi:hypothetical protein